MTINRSKILQLPKALQYIRLSQLQCLNRSYSTIPQENILPRSQAKSGAVLLSTRRLIELQGPQASQFLQGLTTANITPWTEGHPRTVYSAFLNAQGRVLQDVFIYPITNSSGAAANEQGFLIDVDANQVGNLLKWLRKYKLRAKVTIREVPTDEAGVLCTWSDTQQSASTTGINTSDGSSIQDPRAPGFGTRTAGPIQALLDQWKTNPHYSAEIDPESRSMDLQYKIRRYTYGIPEGQDELQYEHALIHDSNIDYMGGVDFRKGCYVGQELVIRTQHTGVVRKRILPCIVYDDGREPVEITYDASNVAGAFPPQGADIKPLLSNDTKKAKSKGKWIAGVGNVGLALCRLEDVVGLGPAGDVVEGWEGREWVFEWENQSEEEKRLRVKAFVPEWWRERIRKGQTNGMA
ncbi:MAG: hypothetical protein GOMPHAMPRED_005588 [Gomphillus americanus]|uniref:Iron-sulfur cluster assembly factor IBA57 homolog, mitochondrial n=1 Tax=Gomphillus americanus TaxID=1940652 RepID=A0A8H3FSV4_9LECA|nr:MAG: hypothetical protein GOMPHAMPRED_005588 [Gomphillus americanus]